MSIISKGFSAIGKLVTLVVMLAAFAGGMVGVVYMSLAGAEIKVPEIVGKDFVESEKELAALGLKIRKRADRVSGEQINTVLEQLPKAGETVKTGQWISVVVSKAGQVNEEPTPSSMKFGCWRRRNEPSEPPHRARPARSDAVRGAGTPPAQLPRSGAAPADGVEQLGQLRCDDHRRAGTRERRSDGRKAAAARL